MPPKVAKDSTIVTIACIDLYGHVSLLLMVSLTKFANVNDPLRPNRHEQYNQPKPLCLGILIALYILCTCNFCK